MAMASCPVANCLQLRQASSNAQRALVTVLAPTERAAYGFAADAFERASDTLGRLPDWRRAK